MALAVLFLSQQVARVHLTKSFSSYLKLSALSRSFSNVLDSQSMQSQCPQLIVILRLHCLKCLFGTLSVSVLISKSVTSVSVSRVKSLFFFHSAFVKSIHGVSKVC